MMTVMAIAVGLAFAFGEPTSSSLAKGWQIPAGNVEALKLVAASGERKSELFVQDASSVAVLDAATGTRIFGRDTPPGAKSSLGDVDADGRIDLLLFTPTGAGVLAEAGHLPDQRKLYQSSLNLHGALDRAIAVRLDVTSASGAVLRSSTGELLAVGPDGKQRWTAIGPAGELVTLDTVSTQGAQRILCAVKTALAVVAPDGTPLWQYASSAGIRRARSLEPRNGASVVVLAEEDGTLRVLSGGNGSVEWTKDLGQPATELRLAEFDGDPASLELVVGGKKGGLWIFSRTGEQLLATSTSAGKIAEIASVPTDASAQELLFISGNQGTVDMVTPQGKRTTVERFGQNIDRLLGGAPSGQPMLFIAAGNTLVARSVVFSAAPAWYSLWWAGAFGCLVVAAVAGLLARQPPARPLHVGSEQMTIEAQRARKIMLRESLTELKQLSSRLAHADLIARLRELRVQMADADRRLLELGATLQPQIFACKRCGGPLEIGIERCEYCGSAVLG